MESRTRAIFGTIATVFIQAAMNAFFAPMGLPTLTYLLRGYLDLPLPGLQVLAAR